MNYCVGFDATLVSNTACDIPLSTLTAAPYRLEIWDVVKVKIAATNAYGSSEYSDLTTDAVI